MRFAVCIRNKGYEASLEVGKLYQVIADRDAEARGYLRIVDESGEDYGYAGIDSPRSTCRNRLRRHFLRRRPDRSPNNALERAARSHSLAAAAHRERWAAIPAIDLTNVRRKGAVHATGRDATRGRHRDRSDGCARLCAGCRRAWVLASARGGSRARCQSGGRPRRLRLFCRGNGCAQRRLPSCWQHPVRLSWPTPSTRPNCGARRRSSLITVPRKRTSAPACSGSGDWQRGRTRRPR